MQSRENGHNNIWLIAGTGEGHRLANLLVEQGWQVTVSVVNDSASLPYQEISLKSIRIGPLQGVEGIKGVLQEAFSLHKGFNWVIDATHPFAVEISANLQNACKEFDQPLVCFERPIEDFRNAYLIGDIKELSTYSLHGRNFLMAIGARQLRKAVDFVHEAGANVFARVLPTPESLRQSLKCSFPESHLAVIRPFEGTEKISYEIGLCRRWSITDVLCRQSGGLTEQLWKNLCEEEKINLWLITRPKFDREVEAMHDFDSILERISSFQ